MEIVLEFPFDRWVGRISILPGSQGAVSSKVEGWSRSTDAQGIVLLKVPEGEPPRLHLSYAETPADYLIRLPPKLIHSVSVQGAGLFGSGAPAWTDQDLEYCSGLAELRELDIRTYRARITDSGLRHVGSLANLEVLAIHGGESTQISDTGVTQLGRLSGLRSLRLSELNRNISGTGFSGCRGLKLVSDLDLRFCQVTDEGVSSIVANLPSLQHLDVSYSRITDAGLASLRSIPSLRSLFVDGTAVGDHGVAELVGVPGLRRLSLQGTSVTGRSEEVFRRIPDLRALTVRDTKVGWLARRRLRRFIPWVDGDTTVFPDLN